MNEGDGAGLEFSFEAFSLGLFPDEGRDGAMDDREAFSLDFRILDRRILSPIEPKTEKFWSLSHFSLSQPTGAVGVLSTNSFLWLLSSVFRFLHDLK